MKERDRARETEGWGREGGLVVAGGEVEELIEKMGVRGVDGGVMSRSLVVGWLREKDMVFFFFSFLFFSFFFSFFLFFSFLFFSFLFFSFLFFSFLFFSFLFFSFLFFSFLSLPPLLFPNPLPKTNKLNKNLDPSPSHFLFSLSQVHP